jgi:hypothetical protein
LEYVVLEVNQIGEASAAAGQCKQDSAELRPSPTLDQSRTSESGHDQRCDSSQLAARTADVVPEQEPSMITAPSARAPPT